MVAVARSGAVLGFSFSAGQFRFGAAHGHQGQANQGNEQYGDPGQGCFWFGASEFKHFILLPRVRVFLFVLPG